MARMNLMNLMHAASILQNPRTDIEEATTSAQARTGPMAPHTGVRAPASVEQSEGKTAAVIAAREADQNLRG